MIVTTSFQQTEETQQRTSIYALQDGSNIKGKFFLLGGSIDQEPVYRYYYKLSDGGFKQSWVKANITEVYETDADPHIVFTEQYDTLPEWVAWPLGPEMTVPKLVDVDIYIPPGSVLQDYSLDLE